MTLNTKLSGGHSHAEDTSVDVREAASPRSSEVREETWHQVRLEGFQSHFLPLKHPEVIMAAAEIASTMGGAYCPPERKILISCRGNSIPYPFSQTQDENAKWKYVRSDCNGPGKLTYGTILDILGKYSKKRWEWQGQGIEGRKRRER